MSKKKFKKKILIPVAILFVLVLVIWVLYHFLISPAQELSLDPANLTSLEDVTANTIPLTQRPYIRLLPTAEAHVFTVELNTLPLSAGEAVTRVFSTQGEQIVAPQTTELKAFPVTDQLTIKKNDASYLSVFLTGAPSYLLTQNYLYQSPSANQITSPDQIFSLQSESLGNLSNLLLINSAGLPPGLPGIITQADPLNSKVATIPLAYQLSSSDELKLNQLQVSFTVSLPSSEQILTQDQLEINPDESLSLDLEENLTTSSASESETDLAFSESSHENSPPLSSSAPSQPTIYGYDHRTRRWTALETTKQGDVYQTTTSRAFDIFALSN